MSPKKNHSKKSTTKKTVDKKKETPKSELPVKSKVKGPEVDEPLKIEDKVVLTIDQELTDTELVSLSRKAIEERDLLNTMKDELKSINTEKKGSIAAQEKKIHDLDILIKSGKKKQAVTAGRIRDFKNTKVLFVKDGTDVNDLKPSDIYKTEPFNEFDYQRKLDLEDGNEGNLKSKTSMFNSMDELKEENAEQIEEEAPENTEGFALAE